MKTLLLEIPDFGDIQPDLEQPFALWDVAEQPLLYHWFDYAIDQEYEWVRLRCAESLVEAVSEAIENATLWPLSIGLATAGDTGESFRVDRLPIQAADAVPSLTSIEDLLAWHVDLSRRRLDHIWDVLRHDFPFIVTGHRAFVHPDAVLEGPYWIGDEVEVEAGAMIGAYTVIGHRSRVRAGATVEDSHIAPDADIAEGIRLNGHTVAPGLIFNHRKRIIHREVDPEIIRFRERR